MELPLIHETNQKVASVKTFFNGYTRWTEAAEQPTGKTGSRSICMDESEPKYCQPGPSIPSSSKIGRRFRTVEVRTKRRMNRDPICLTVPRLTLTNKFRNRGPNVHPSRRSRLLLLNSSRFYIGACGTTSDWHFASFLFLESNGPTPHRFFSQVSSHNAGLFNLEGLLKSSYSKTCP